MSRRYVVPPATKRLQAEASDPSSSAWVSANAGSGKTHVLALRVIRLMLAGAEPSRILCLTYTRAAASVMANRVFRDLAAWTTLDDAGLSARVEEIEGRTPDDATLKRARRLFATALETPGGLKIQTIHAFCEALLHKFPLEANIAGHFELVDGRMEQALFAEARRSVIAGAAAAENPALGEAFATILGLAGETGLDNLLGEIVAKRDRLRAFIQATGEDTLAREFGFAPDDTEASVSAEFWPLPGFTKAEMDRLARAAERHGAGRVLEHLLPGALAAFAESDPVRRFALLCSGFLGGKGEPYKPDWLFKKALLGEMPDLGERYLAAAGAIVDHADRLATLRMVQATAAVRVLADALIGRYERLKAGRGLLDFNDLISRTANLLARSDAGPWVQYKLDQGIDHILIDEAQDTSPQQWEVVHALAGDFFAGAGQRGARQRTVFAVGDEKQSIYSFQGADPAAFGESRVMFRQRARGAGGAFADVKLNLSFRSTDDVLSAVDLVFSAEEIRKGVTTDPEFVHSAIRAGEPGIVEVWKALGPVDAPEPDDWTEPVDHASAPAVRVAERVAARIERMVGAGEARPGDIMVLVRKRDRFVHALAKSLKDRRVAVAGADRLSLSAHIAVQDMMALGRFCLLPEDDLSLAALLRSPVFGFSDEQLFDIASGRGEVSLWSSLQRRAPSDPGAAYAVGMLEAWRNLAAFRPVFEFYAEVLGPGGARRRLVGRLGEDAGDILDEFLTFCLAEERAGLTGLDTVIAALETAAPEIKREMDQSRDEVRIMTVHGSKGMEAPVVFLVDSGGAPFVDQHLPRLMPYVVRSEGPLASGHPVAGFLWRASSEMNNRVLAGIAADAKRAADEEYRRLLYVGMTRAGDRLIVCGYHGKRGQGAGTWHSIVTGAIAASPRTIVAGAAPEEMLVYRVNDGPVAPPPREAAAGQVSDEAMPAALRKPLPPEPALPRPLAPSGATALIEEDAEPVASPRSPVLEAEWPGSMAVARGLAVHKLLQVLPDLPESDREAAAARYLGRIGADWAAAERDAAARSVLGILGDPAFAPLFGEGSRAEVELMGTLRLKGRDRAIAGKVDRLVVLADRVLIADFKTNRPPPASVEAVPEAYRIQLALYRELLRRIYPGKKVDAALVFTETPAIMPVPPDVLDASLARLTAP